MEESWQEMLHLHYNSRHLSKVTQNEKSSVRQPLKRLELQALLSGPMANSPCQPQDLNQHPSNCRLRPVTSRSTDRISLSYGGDLHRVMCSGLFQFCSQWVLDIICIPHHMRPATALVAVLRTHSRQRPHTSAPGTLNSS